MAQFPGCPPGAAAQVHKNTVYRAPVPVTCTADQSELLTHEPCLYFQVIMQIGNWVWNTHLLTPELGFLPAETDALRALVSSIMAGL